MRLQDRIENKLRAGLQPAHLEIVNESHMHSVPPGSETHFKVVIVSPQFEGRSLIDRQRLVHSALQDELHGGLHALSCKTLTPAQWEAAGGKIDYPSPLCRGGSK